MRKVQVETGVVGRLALAWIGLNLADACVSLFAFQYGLTEGNPILSSFCGPVLLPIKFVSALVVLLILARLRHLKLLLPLNIGLGLVVIWNVAMVLVSS